MNDGRILPATPWGGVDLSSPGHVRLDVEPIDIARIGNVPLGYYKDEEKTAKTFPTLADGTRISILGDMGTVEADGSIVF